MYAYVETGGKQYKVAPGDTIKVEKLSGAPGSIVTLDKVLTVIKDGTHVMGNPYVAKASVSAEVVKTAKDKKVLVFMQKPRKDMRRLRGHRQELTTLKIKEIKGV